LEFHEVVVFGLCLKMINAAELLEQLDSLIVWR